MTASGQSPQFGPTQPAPQQFGEPILPTVRLRVARYSVLVLIVLLACYLIVVVVLANLRTEPGSGQAGGTRVTLTARTVDGSRPTNEALSQAQSIIRKRARGLGIADAQVSVDGENLTVTVPDNYADELDGIVETGRLYLRPVLTSTPAQAASASADPNSTGAKSTTDQPAPQQDPRKDFADRIAQEKKRRQGTNQYIQMVALQFEATRCDQPDILAGNDDPDLPLVTCSTDHTAAYLLGPSIIKGRGVRDAGVGSAPGNAGYVVDLQFDDAAKTVWAQYTATHVGTQVAFTLDSQVLSAPTIQEAIPGGRTQISGGAPAFTEARARQLADVLGIEPLPLAFETSGRETVTPQPGSKAPVFRFPPVLQVAPALVLLPALLGALGYLYRQEKAAPVPGWRA